MTTWPELFERLDARFGDAGERLDAATGRTGETAPPELWSALAARGSVRAFAPEPPETALLETIAAVALAAPTKSDLQQRDLILVDNPDVLTALKALVADQAWTAGLPAMVVVCANNRRQRQGHARAGHPFANDHLDAFFNASVDAGIVLASYALAAEAAGLGICPISALRNAPEAVSEILDLPDHVFAIAGLAVGWPAAETRASLRLPLGVTVHRNRFDEADAEAAINAYDQRRARLQPYRTQRSTERFGTAEPYTWTEDKARQYALPERQGFGAFIRAKGFRLD